MESSPTASSRLPFHLVTDHHLAILGPAIHACIHSQEVGRGAYILGNGNFNKPRELRSALENYFGNQPSRIRRPGDALLTNFSNDMLSAVYAATLFIPLPPERPSSPHLRYYRDVYGRKKYY